MPSRVVAEVFLYHLFRHIAFPLYEVNILSAVFRHFLNFLEVSPNNPKPIVPAVEVSFVHLKHLAAKTELPV
jgi:hypothetical protein